MEVQFIIKGTYGEVAEFAKTIYEGLGTKGVYDKMEHVCDPRPEPSFSRSLEDDQEPPYYEAEHRSHEMKCAPLPGPPQNMEGAGLGKPKGNEAHCHQCGTLFHPKREKTKFCSKRCYMLEWREVHNAPKQLKEVKGDVIRAEIPEPAEPPKEFSPKNREEHLLELSAKLKRIKENDPSPTNRPDITRETL